MKSRKTIFLFEWKKNHTTLFLVLALFILFIGCLFFGWLSNSLAINNRWTEPNIIFNQVDYASSYEIALQNYEQDASIDNYLNLKKVEVLKEMQNKYRASAKNYTKRNYIGLGEIYSKWLNLLQDEVTEAKKYYYETGILKEDITIESEEKDLIEKVFLGDDRDYLYYQKKMLEQKLSDLQEMATTDLTEEEKEKNEQYNQYYMENIELITFLEDKETIEEWEINLIDLILVKDLPIFDKNTILSEARFNIDATLKQEYKTYDNYVAQIKKGIEEKRLEREVQVYQLKNGIPPTDSTKGNNTNDKIEGIIIDYIPWGMALTFFVFLAFFGWNLVTEHNKGQDRMVLTRQYSYSTILQSKMLYYACIFLILCFYFLIFYMIASMIYHVDLETLYVVTKGNSIITYTYFNYLLENVVRLGMYYCVLIEGFVSMSILTKSLALSFIGSALLFGIGSLLPIYLVQNVYLGNEVFVSIGVSILIIILLQLGNTILYKKKW